MVFGVMTVRACKVLESDFADAADLTADLILSFKVK
jgi:hypothetical protein